MQRLGIIGAGPKAAAICAKAAVLKKQGYFVPEVHVFEKHAEPGAQWSGTHGYTDGKQTLGTFPEQDVGYPYLKNWGPFVEEEMLKRFSWQSFLIDRGEYTKWVDRDRPQPVHREWSEYIAWVFTRAKDLAPEIVHLHTNARVTRLDSDDGVGRWHVTCGTDFDVDALVITGHGEPSRAEMIEDARAAAPERVFDGRDFWNRWSDDIPEGSSILVVGTGETAAAIVARLVPEHIHRGCTIWLVNRQGTIYSRGESFHESRLYSDPSEWQELPVDQRLDFLKRTDKSVVSQSYTRAVGYTLHQRLDVQRIAFVRKLQPTSGEDNEDSRDHIEVTGESAGVEQKVACDYLVWAAGFDALWFRALLADGTKLPKDRDAARQAIAPDLSLGGARPPLHLPVLADLQCGPGFPNLTSLGLVADRVLLSYVKAN